MTGTRWTAWRVAELVSAAPSSAVRKREKITLWKFASRANLHVRQVRGDEAIHSADELFAEARLTVRKRHPALERNDSAYLRPDRVTEACNRSVGRIG